MNDAESYQKYFADYDVIRQMAAVIPWPYPKNGVREYLETIILPQQGKDKWVWGIFLKENPNELIGCVDLWRDGKPENRGFWLGKKFWGHGLMTEAVNPVMDYAFDVLGFERLVFANALGNDKSRRVKEKTGARLVRIETSKYVDPDLSKQEVWELTKQEWKRFKHDQ